MKHDQYCLSIAEKLLGTIYSNKEVEICKRMYREDGMKKLKPRVRRIFQIKLNYYVADKLLALYSVPSMKDYQKLKKTWGLLKKTDKNALTLDDLAE